MKKKYPANRAVGLNALPVVQEARRKKRKTSMSNTERRILAYMADFFLENHRSPTSAEVAKSFGYNDYEIPLVSSMRKNLVKLGMLARVATGDRGKGSPKITELGWKALGKRLVIFAEEIK